MRFKKPLKPLSKATLDALAMRYAGRFAVSPAKLRSFLQRKIKERGLAPDFAPDLDQLIEKMSEYGAVSDQAVANMVIASHQRRGLGSSRMRQQLQLKQVDRDVADTVMEEKAVTPEILAIIYAQKKRLGVFRDDPATDPKRLEKDIAAMVRAGHRPGIAVRIVRAASVDELYESFGLEEGFDILP